MHPRLLRSPSGCMSCAVEVAAGFALYVLGSLLLLHLIATHGLDEATALRWSAAYNAADVLAPLVGGALADAGLRLHGAVRLGAILLSFGFVAWRSVAMRAWGFRSWCWEMAYFAQTWLRCSVAYTPSAIRALMPRIACSTPHFNFGGWSRHRSRACSRRPAKGTRHFSRRGCNGLGSADPAARRSVSGPHRCMPA